ncbi:MAG: cobalamin biosynthesis protein CobW [Rhizobiales bacterium]|nr:cobalamin biosynthesis protein CobW [Hyphomicrobiales bacterium]NRB13600.1 cobalamin biosynthesis protein CobW [Hyphomicrobiales bacterium]
MQANSLKKIPATVITGFLGAGKTTLIQHLLANIGDKKIALIINEFGDLGIDGNLLAACGNPNCTEDDIIELTNGCICCTVADDFIPAIEKILARDVPPEHIIIETSGLALPQPLVAAFNWPEIKAKVTISGVITLADAEALAEGRFAHDEAEVEAQRQADESLDHISSLHELFEDQLICADMILLNKAELVNAEKLKDLTAEITREAREGVPVVAISRGIIDPNIILGLDMNAENDLASRKSHHELEHEAQHESGAPHHHEHDHDDFKSISIDLPTISDVAQFEAGLAGLISQNKILRLKGFMAVKGKDMRYIIQAVGPRIEGYFDRMWGFDEQQQSRLVVISDAKFNEVEVTEQLRQLAAH